MLLELYLCIFTEFMRANSDTKQKHIVLRSVHQATLVNEKGIHMYTDGYPFLYSNNFTGDTISQYLHKGPGHQFAVYWSVKYRIFR